MDTYLAESLINDNLRLSVTGGEIPEKGSIWCLKMNAVTKSTHFSSVNSNDLLLTEKQTAEEFLKNNPNCYVVVLRAILGSKNSIDHVTYRTAID